MHMASTPKNKTATSVGKSAQETSKRSPKSPNPPKQSKPKSSIGLGLLLIVIGTSLIGLGGLGYLFYQELLGGAKREVERSAESQSQKLEAKLANVRQSTSGVAIAVRALAQQPPKPKAVEAYQRLVAEGLQRSETIAGIGIVQNDNLLFTGAKTVVPYVWTEQSGLKLEVSGKKLPAPNDKLLAGNRSNITNIPPYKLPIASAKESWSEPYSALGKTMITYSAPIIDGQKVLGVVNADAIASNLMTIATTNPNSDSKIGFVVVSASGNVITASEQFQTTQSQNPAVAEALKTLAQQVKVQPTGISQSGGNLWAYQKIEGSDWLIASYLPEAEITNKLFVLVGGAAIGISAILAIAVLGFINSLKKRLQPLTEECNRFLAQQGSSNLDLAGKDEIDRLGLSLKSTLHQVKTNEIRLRHELVQNPNPPVGDISAAQAQQNVAETELMEAEVGDLLDVVSSMEEGDLTIEAQVNDRATGLVADTLNRLREKLVEIISSVLGTAQQVAQGASDLEELARTVVLNTAEQAQSVAQGQALTAQVAAIAERSSEQVNVANQSLQEVRHTVASGQTAINNLTTSISVLQTGSAQIVQRMKTLGEFVGLAEQFVQDQGQIASLTQVLALNATLVAARAAEQKDPKQFAGVAREFEAIAGQVNDLATQTNDGLTVLQQRTSQIQTVVTAIDAEVQNLSGLVSGFTTGVEESQSAFNSIQIATEEVVQIGQTITESSTEIADAAGSTASYISEIAQLADRTADLTRSARQQAESMGNQAQRLLQEIQFFRLPESSGISDDVSSATSSEVNAFVDSPEISPEISPDTSVNSLFDSTTEATEANENNNLGLVVPAIAVAAAATAVVISQTGQDIEYAASEEESDNTALDGKYLESLIDESINEGADTDINDQNDQISGNYELSELGELSEPVEELPQEQNFADNFIPKHEAANPFLDPADNPYREAAEASYSDLTDISIIEESLLADLRQEIYSEDAFSDEDELIFEPEQSLKDPMEGVNEFAIVDASSDPMIVSATSSFLEDTAFGTPSPLSEDAIANLPTSVDFSIPDLDDQDFSMPKIDIQSTLDDSNAFFDSDSVQQNDIESGFDPFAIEEPIQTESTDYAVSDDVFYADYQTEGTTEEFLSDGLSSGLSDALTDNFNSNQVEDYGNYASIEDYSNYTSENFNESPELTLQNTSDVSFNDAFDTSIDQFDQLRSDQSEDLYNPIEESYGNDADNFVSAQTGDYNAYVSHEEFNTSLEENLESASNEAFSDTFNSSFDELPFDLAFGEALNSSSNTIENQDIINQANPADLPSQIPDIYLDELTDDESTDEFAFEFQNEPQDESLGLSDAINLAEPDDNIFNTPNFNIDDAEISPEIIDPFAVQVEENDLVQDQGYLGEDYLGEESAIASDFEFQDSLDTSLNTAIQSEEFALNLEEETAMNPDDLSNILLDESNNINNIFDTSDVYSIDESIDSPVDEEFTDPFSIESNAITNDVSDLDNQELDAFEASFEPTNFGLEDLPNNFDDLGDVATEIPTENYFDDLESLPTEDFGASDEFGSLSQLLDLEQEESSIASVDRILNDEDSDVSFILNSISSQSWATDDQESNIQDSLASAEDSFNSVFEEELVDAGGFAEAIASPDSLLDFNETLDSANISNVDTLDFEESAIFESLSNDINDLEFPESAPNIEESTFDNIQMEPVFTESTPDLVPDFSDNLSENFSDDWLQEPMTDEDEDIGVFADLSMDEYQSINDLTPNVASEDISVPSYGFADNLLDSLMEESNEEIADLSMDLPDFAIGNDLPLSNPLESMNTSSDGLEDLSALSNDSDSEFDFDFSAFDDLVDDDSNLDVATLESSINVNPTNNVDSSINTTVKAREEIDDFLSNTFDFEEIDNTIPENITIKADDEPKPKKPTQNDK